MNSLDVIEDCLSQIYRCRKALLTKKTQSEQFELDRRKEKFKKVGYQSEENKKKHHHHKNHKKEDSDNEKEGESGDEEEDDVAKEDERLAKDLMASYPMPALAPLAPSSPMMKAPPPNKGLVKQLTKEELATITNQFQAEIQRITQDGSNSSTPMDVEMICDGLIDRYLSHQLDDVEQTREISHLKKFISESIEVLANELDEINDGIIIAAQGPAARGAVAVAGATVEGSSNKPNSNSNNATIKNKKEVTIISEPTATIDSKQSNGQNSSSKNSNNVNSKVQQQQEERFKIKEQYAKYLSGKNKQQEKQERQVKQGAVVQQREHLADDIQEVLNSIRNQS